MSVNSIECISESYYLLKINYSELKSKCTTPVLVGVLDKQYRLARRNFYAAINTIIDENNDAVEVLRERLEENTAEIKKSLKDQEQIDKILGLITDGVDVATSLLSTNGTTE